MAVAAGLIGCKSSDDQSGGTATAGNLDVLPTTPFTTSADRGGPFDESALYTVRNSGDDTLFWSVQPTAPWLSVSTGSGTLSPGESVALTVAVDSAFASGLDPGRYSGNLPFRDLGRGITSVVLSASLEILPVGQGTGALEVSPTGFTTGGPKGGPFVPASQVLALSNPGTAAIQWTATSDAAWVMPMPSSGTLASGAQQQVTLTIQAGTAGALLTGGHAGKVTFRNAQDSATLAEVDVSLGIGTTIEDQAWLNVHGRPFFPIGVWNQPPWESQVLYLKGLGINTYVNNGFGPVHPTDPQLMDLLEAHGMWGILRFNPAVKDHPRILGWLLEDEPDVTNTPPSVVQQNYDAVKAADPDHFVALNTMGLFYWDSNFGNPASESLYQAYTAIPDICSFDFYPVSGWHQTNWEYLPGAMVEFLLERYVDHEKPGWAIIETCDLVQTDAHPGPSPAQMRFEVWDSIIHGATAIHYFTIAFDPFVWTNLTPTIEQELTRTNGQITSLTDVILSPAPGITVSSWAASGLNHNFMLRRRGDSYFLFVDNADMGYRSETITFTFPQAISSVSVWDEGRSITPVGGSFTDTFAPLEVHIYEVRL